MFEIEYYNRFEAKAEIVVIEGEDFEDAVYNALGSWIDVLAIRPLYTDPEPS